MSFLVRVRAYDELSRLLLGCRIVFPVLHTHTHTHTALERAVGSQVHAEALCKPQKR